MSSLIYEKKDRIAYVTLNRPEKLNAMDPEMVVRLAEAWQDFNNDDNLRVAILSGAGDRAFTAGADLGRLIPLIFGNREPEDEWDQKVIKDNLKMFHIAMLKKYELYKPIIAAINGICLAGGTELLQVTDIRVAAENALFGLPEVTRAIAPAAVSLALLPRQVPYCNAMEILLVGDHISAEEAYRMGLINYVLPKKQVMAKAQELAGKIAENGPLAVRLIKETVLKSSGHPIDIAHMMEENINYILSNSEDAKEGPRAFIEKRKPVYKGR